MATRGNVLFLFQFFLRFVVRGVGYMQGRVVCAEMLKCLGLNVTMTEAIMAW